jgi:hypothetical protein
VEDLEFWFDDLLFQIAKGNTHEKLENNIRYEQFQQVGEWNLRFGFKFNIYPNDHLINDKPHFHFDHEAHDIFCKVDFTGIVLETTGSKEISKKVLKELIYFVSKPKIKSILVGMWNEKNPDLKQAFDEPCI